MASNLTWLQAFTLATTPGVMSPVRRVGWQLWIYSGSPLFFLWIPAGADPEVLRVCVNTDVEAADMLATDWTDEPWVAAGVETGPSQYPPGFGDYTAIPQTSVPTAPVAGAPAVASAPGSSSPPPAAAIAAAVLASAPLNFGSVSDPPGSNAMNLLSSGGGGGGASGSGTGGSEQGPAPAAPLSQSLPSSNPAVVTVQIALPTMLELQAACPSGRNFNGSCFSPVGDVDTPMSLAALDCTVIIAGGPPGVGTLSVQLGSGTPQLGTGWPGMAQGFEFTSVTFQPGNTVTITATYVIDSVTYTGSATYQLPPWCGWVAPTKLLWSGIGWSGSFPVSGEVRVNGLTSVGDAAVPTASAGIMGSVPLYPGGGSEQWVLNVSTPTYPVSVTVSYFWAPGSLTLSGTVTYSSDSAATYSGDVEAG